MKNLYRGFVWGRFTGSAACFLCSAARFLCSAACFLFSASCLSFSAGGHLFSAENHLFAAFERYEAGFWTGEGGGYRGPIRLRVETNATSIIAVEVLESREDEWCGGAALDELCAMALDTSGAGVDAVSGATVTSEGFFAALEDALERAKKPGFRRGGL